MKRQCIFLLLFLFLLPVLWITSGCKKTPGPAPAIQKVYKGYFRPLTKQEVVQFSDSNYQVIDGSLILDSISGLKDLSAFSTITKITGDLVITHNPDLLTLHGIENLLSTGRRITIWENRQLKSATSFNKLTSTGGISIMNNPALTAITFLRLKEAGDLMFMNNASLRSISGMNDVTTTGFFFISQHPTLTQINAFKSLKTVTRNFFFDFNDSLTNIDWAGQLQSIDGAMGISNNQILQNLNGLKNLKTVGNFLILEFNPELENIDGLGKLRYVGKDLEIQANPELKNINGLHSLYEVKNYFFLNDNDKITNINGLEALRKVHLLSISYNSKLYNFCGLKDLLYFGTVDTLNILGNLANPNIKEIKQKSCGNASSQTR